MKLLKFTLNRYRGVVVAPEDLPSDIIQFQQQLTVSLSHWQSEKYKVAWCKVNSNQTNLLATLYSHGFENHHCGKQSMMLTKRLLPNALIPEYANHTIGIGGLVINENHELLTIRELDHIKTHPHNWKFPGGMLDPYEHIESAAIREVYEETGIKTQFESFIGFRHHHAGQFETSNIYAVCLLKPLSHEIKIQESEIFDAKWIPVNEYLQDEKIAQYNKLILQSALNSPGLKSIKLPDYMGSEQEYEVFMGTDLME